MTNGDTPDEHAAAPGPGQPAYGQPASGQPAYGQPVSGQPAYGQAGYAPPGTPPPPGSAPAAPGGPGSPPGPVPPGAWRGLEPSWPGVVPLRPLSFSDILEGAFRVLRFNPKTMLGMTAVVLLVAYALGLTLALLAIAVLGSSGVASSATSQNIQSNSTWTLGLVSVFLAGILIPPISEAVLGTKMTPREAWHAVKGRLLSLIGATLIIGLINAVIIVLIVGVAFGIIVGVSGSADPWTNVGALIVVGVVGLFVAGLGLFLLNAWFMLAAPAVVLEGLGPVQGLRRATQLIRGGYWRAVLIQLLASVIAAFVTALVMLPLTAILVAGILAAALGSSGSDPATFAAGLLIAVVTGLLTVAVSTFTQPFASSVTALIYLDRRFRTEDLAVALQQEGDRRAAAARLPGS